MKSLLTIILIITALLMILAVSISAEIPLLINYQGKLTNTDGSAVDDGRYIMKFKIWDHETASDAGLNLKWDSQFRGIDVISGLFAYNLGDTISIPHIIVKDNPEMWLGITIGSDDELTPRVRLISVPYALQSLRSDSAQYAFEIADNSVTTLKITDLAVTNAKLADNSVTESKIADNAVTSAKIGTSAVTTDEIANGTILLEDIGPNGATEGQLMKWSSGTWTLADDGVGSGNGWIDNGNSIVLETITDSVGIGVIDPQEKLDVEGNILSNSTITKDNAVIGTATLVDTSTLYVEKILDDANGIFFGIESKISNTQNGYIGGIRGYAKTSNAAFGSYTNGIYGQAYSNEERVGILGMSFSEDPELSLISGLSTGVEGFATKGSQTIGVMGTATDGDFVYGVYGTASGGTNVYGVYGTASGGTSNWAGFFDGDTRITGDLTLDGALNISAPFSLTGNTTFPNAIIEGHNQGIAWGVLGHNTTSDNYGYLGTASEGVFGKGTIGAGVVGYGSTSGVEGYSDAGTIGKLSISNAGVKGEHTASGNFGFLGTPDHGVYGYSEAGSAAVLGEGIDVGVAGINIAFSESYGLLGTAVAGVYGNAAPGGLAGDFNGTVGISGDLYLGGSLNATIPFTFTENLPATEAIIEVYNTGTGYGVKGEHTTSGNYGYLGDATRGVYGYGSSGTGVYGYGTAAGVEGARSSGAYGALGHPDAGVYGAPGLALYAGKFEGDVSITNDLTVDNSIYSPLTKTNNFRLGSTTASGDFKLYRIGSVPPVLEMRTTTNGGSLTLWEKDGIYQTFMLENDNNGYGAYLSVTSNASGNGFTVDGNYNYTESPKVSLLGNGCYMTFDASISGNDAVVLANEAISSTEMFNEPGISQGIKKNTTVYMDGSSTMIDIVTVTINIPTAGYIVVETSGQLSLFGTTSPNYIYFQIDETAGGSASSSYRQRAGYYNPPNTGQIHQSVSTRRTYYKSIAGSYTFRLEANDGSGFGSKYLYNTAITAMYIPTSYGSVSTVASSQEISDFDNAEPILLNSSDEERDTSTEIMYKVDLRDLELKVARAEADTERLKRELIQSQLVQKNKKK